MKELLLSTGSLYTRNIDSRHVLGTTCKTSLQKWATKEACAMIWKWLALEMLSLVLSSKTDDLFSAPFST